MPLIKERLKRSDSADLAHITNKAKGILKMPGKIRRKKEFKAKKVQFQDS